MVGESKINEKQGMHRLLLISSHCPSITTLRKARLSFLLFVTPQRRRTASDLQRILSIPVSDLHNKFVLGQENKEKPGCSPPVRRAPVLTHLPSPCGCGTFCADFSDRKNQAKSHSVYTQAHPTFPLSILLSLPVISLPSTS